MATQVGVIKQVSGTVVAVDANGKERILTAGDAIFFGEIVKTIGNNSNAVIVMDGGKDVSILANNTVLIDQNILNIQNQNINTIADINDLQKAILAGKDLTQLEETAAGGGDTGSGDGVSLGEARFAEGGHESNIYAYGRNINDTHYAFATPINSVGGANSDNSNIKDVIVLDTFVSLSVELKTAEGNDNIITEKELHDGVDGEKIVGELVVGKDIVVDMTNDKIAISVDGRKIGDAKITRDLGNGKYEYELTNIRTEEFTDGTSNKPNGKIEAVYNAVDKQGNHKDVTANNIYEVEFDHISIDAKVSLNVSEEGLPGGIKDNKGTNDTTNSIEDNKSINVVSASKVTFEFAVTDGANSGLKSGGEKIIWKSVPAVGGDGKSISIIGVKETSGETVLTVKLNKETGATKVVLEKPVDHDPAGNGEDVVTASVAIKATNAHGAIAKVCCGDKYPR